MRKVNEEDISMLKYFWEEKGSLERYCDFEEIKQDLKENYPAVFNAWYNYRASIQTMDFIIKNVSYDGDDL